MIICVLSIPSNTFCIHYFLDNYWSYDNYVAHFDSQSHLQPVQPKFRPAATTLAAAAVRMVPGPQSPFCPHLCFTQFHFVSYAVMWTVPRPMGCLKSWPLELLALHLCLKWTPTPTKILMKSFKVSLRINQPFPTL